jgi:hypothetical protein
VGLVELQHAVPLKCAARLIWIVLGKIQLRILSRRKPTFVLLNLTTESRIRYTPKHAAWNFPLFYSQYPYNADGQVDMAGVVGMLVLGVLTM